MEIKTVFNNYIEELITKYGEQEGIKVLIIKISVLLYPVLKAQGVWVSAPVALVTDSVNSAEFIMCDLSGVIRGSSLSTSLSAKEMRKVIAETEYELVTLVYVRSQNSIPNLQMLQTACMTGNSLEGQFSALPVVFFNGAIAGDAKDFFAGQICITPKYPALLTARCASSNGVDFAHMIIRHICADWAAVKLEMCRAFQSEGYQKIVEDIPGAEMFFVAEKFLELLLESQGYHSSDTRINITQCRNALSDIVKEWQIVTDGSAWLDILHSVIYQASTRMPGILNRNHVPAKAIGSIDSWPLYDDEFYYLPSKLFDEFCAEISQSISMKEVKGLLAEKSILVGEGRNRLYLTIKAPVTTEYGAILEPRKIRLRREWLDLDGGLTWREMIEVNAESEVE